MRLQSLKEGFQSCLHCASTASALRCWAFSAPASRWQRRLRSPAATATAMVDMATAMSASVSTSACPDSQSGTAATAVTRLLIIPRTTRRTTTTRRLTTRPITRRTTTLATPRSITAATVTGITTVTAVTTTAAATTAATTVVAAITVAATVVTPVTTTAADNGRYAQRW